VAGGLLYVEPVYIERANQESSYPQLARVLVSYNGRVGYDANLANALDEVFGAGAGADVSVTPGGTGTPQTPPVDPSTGVAPPAAPSAGPDLTTAAAAVRAAIDSLKAAQQNGDFQGQGAALQSLDTAVEQFEQAQAAAGGAAAPPITPAPVPPPATPGG
jgi:hypothetical protein